MTNRRWLLHKRPNGKVSRDCFDYREEPAAERPAGASVKLRYEMFLCAPTIRNWISGARNSFHPVVDLGEAVLAPAVARVVDSDDPAWPTGARVFGPGRWQDEQWINPALGAFRRLRPDVSPLQALGIAGPNALTAYFGLLRVGRPEPGETLLVSGAAGSVGSAVAQIGRIQGCRVIGICGGGEKRRWLAETCGIEAVIDYKTEDLAASLDRLAPEGIDVYFDNVGGETLRVAIDRIRRFGRVVLCGQIADYDQSPPPAQPPLNMMRLIYGHARIEGFLARDYADQFDAAIDDLLAWDAAGRLRHREDVRTGFQHLPETFAALFSGDNRGTLIARIADEQGHPL